MILRQEILTWARRLGIRDARWSMRHRKGLVVMTVCFGLIFPHQNSSALGEEAIIANQEATKSETEWGKEASEQSETRGSTSASEGTPQRQLYSSVGDKGEADVKKDDRVETPTPPAGPRRYRLQFSQFSRYNNNFFSAGSGKPKKDAFVTTLAGKIAADFLRREASTLTGEFQVARTFVGGIDDADWFQFNFALDYEFGPNDLTLAYFYTPERLTSDDLDDDQGKFRSINGTNLEFSRRLSRRIRTRVSYEFTREDFSGVSESDSDQHKLSADVRYRVHDLFIPGIGFELAWLRDESHESSYNDTALVLRLRSRIKDSARISLRYRYRMRDYVTDDPTFSNFGREDHRHEVQLLARFKLSDHWWPYLFGSYKHNDSTRDTRTYSVEEVGFGILYRFP